MKLGLVFMVLFGIKSPGWNLAVAKLLATSQPLSHKEGTSNSGLGLPLGMFGKLH